MKASVETEETFRTGEPSVIQSRSPRTTYAVVFEDDGETGYFYGLDLSREENPILDALHIYNVDTVANKHIPAVVQIQWTDDGLKSALVINNFLHAVFDFGAKRGCCRNNFPPPDRNWTPYDHEWDDAAVGLFGKDFQD